MGEFVMGIGIGLWFGAVFGWWLHSNIVIIDRKPN